MEEATNPEVNIRKPKFTWSKQQTLQLINLRMQHDAQFTGHRKASAHGFDMIIREMGLDDSLTTVQAAKKWENLKKKYKDLILRSTGSGTEGGEVTAANWPFLELMHKALGWRNSTTSLNINITAGDSDDEKPDVVTSTLAPDPSTTLCWSEGSTRLRLQKRKNTVLEYLKEYTERQEKRQREMDEREEERAQKKMDQMDRVIDIFGKLVEKL
ncbi:hypothetical protein DPEC_G00228160 [Dallia pectoralis]|uniref:Uncharacterized protein n=1 Tax=Dallia pectoralis TaxID=75939 RepID=A0ACC2G0U8_DALPE|nr:hypothetical protein DPEC_G00228160 [Dallia pectoralis]